MKRRIYRAKKPVGAGKCDLRRGGRLNARTKRREHLEQSVMLSDLTSEGLGLLVTPAIVAAENQQIAQIAMTFICGGNGRSIRHLGTRGRRCVRAPFGEKEDQEGGGEKSALVSLFDEYPVNPAHRDQYLILSARVAIGNKFA